MLYLIDPCNKVKAQLREILQKCSDEALFIQKTPIRMGIEDAYGGQLPPKFKPYISESANTPLTQTHRNFAKYLI